VRIDRRGFLRGSLAATLPLAFPGFLQGATPPPSERLRLGVIGVGGQGSGAHARTWTGLPESRLVAVCDVNRKAAAEAKAQADAAQNDKSCAAYGDFRELLARDDIDAVSIAVPDHWHALIALAAIRAGKHVYLEKPLAYTVEEGRALVEAVRRHGVVLQNGTQQRSLSPFQRATWLARSGRLGKVHTAIATSPYGPQGGDPTPADPPPEIDYEFWLGPAPWKPYTPGRCSGHGGVGWYHIRDYSGGWITAWGSHHVDCAQWALGRDAEAPVAVEAWGEFAKGGVYDTCYKWHAEFRYADGVKLVFATPGEAQGRMDVLIQGDEGWVCANRGQIDAHPKSLLAEQPGPLAEPWPTHHYRDFLQAIREGREPAAPIEGAHLSTTLCHLANIAIVLQRPLRWDGARERFIDDPVADRMLSSPMRTPWSLQA
nr:Gfo/Idh/MocA family oxidoreductase [Akkermansiaceae bacterium]